MGYLIAIRPDGTEGESFALLDGDTMLGRKGCDLTFPDDEYLAPQHAVFTHADGVLRVHDVGSEHGVFARITEAVELAEGAQFRVGQELLTVELVEQT